MAWTVPSISPVGLGLGQSLDGPGWLGGFRLAGGLLRTISFAIDFVVTILLPNLIANLTSHPGSVSQDCGPSGLYCREVEHGAANHVGLGVSICLLLIIVNVGVLNGRTGQSVGKLVTGTYLAVPMQGPSGESALCYPGVARSLARFVLHFFDVITLGFGFLRAAWDPRRQTFADSIIGTVVVRGPITLRRNFQGWKV